MSYPDRHHPVFMLQDELIAMGIDARFAKDERTLDCWGLVFPDHDNRVFVWLIDNRLPHESVKEDPAAKDLLKRGAIVAHAQRPDMERVGGHWLPLAASPGFDPVVTVKTSDCAMVGYIRDEGRARVLADIGKHFRLNLAQGVFGVRAVETYCSALCGVNIPSHFGTEYAYDSWNMRAPEIMACGVPLLTQYQPYLIDLGIIPGHNALCWTTVNDLLECLRVVVSHPESASAIGREGRKLVQDRHTYKHRAMRVKQWLSE